MKSFHFSLYNCRCLVVYNCTGVQITEQGCSVGLLVLGLSFLKLCSLGLEFSHPTTCELVLQHLRKERGRELGALLFERKSQSKQEAVTVVPLCLGIRT